MRPIKVLGFMIDDCYNSNHVDKSLNSNEGCQCNLDGNCTKALHLYIDPICNCDTMYPGSIDEGFLTSSEALPVMELSYGGSFTQTSSIQYILGPLICTGLKFLVRDS